MNCNYCRKVADSLDLSTCLTAHVESEDLGISHEDCYDDLFYCKDCLNDNDICKYCEKDLSIEDQVKIVKRYEGEI